MGTFRFLLAVIVAAEHFGGAFGHRGYFSGMIAVQTFYVISGFLIALILHRKYDTSAASGLWLFYSNRALRILLPYWVALFAIAALSAVVGVGPLWNLLQALPDMDLWARLYFIGANLLILGQEWVMWLTYEAGQLRWVLSSDGETPHPSDFLLIPQAWSVSLELMFYALAPLLVRVRSQWLIAYIVLAHCVRGAVVAGGLTGSGFAYRFLPLELGLFMGGILAYRLYALLSPYFTLCWSLLIAAVPVLALFVMPYWPRWEDPRFFLLVALTLPALFHVSRAFAFDRFLGELSYPIYLMHLAVLLFGTTIMQRAELAMPAYAGFALLAATVLWAALYVRALDAPLERWRQSRAMTPPHPALSLTPQPNT